jgi:hypothetical protein
MLDLSINIRRFYRPASSVIFLTTCLIEPLHSSDFNRAESKAPRHFEQEWVTRYLNSIDDDTDVEEVVDFLITLRENLVSQEYCCPPLSQMALDPIWSPTMFHLVK